MPFDPLLIVGVSVAAVFVAVAGVWLWRGRRSSRSSDDSVRPQTLWVTGLAKMRGNLGRRLLETWGAAGEGNAWLARAEEILLSSDVGVPATRALLSWLGDQVASITSAAELRELLRSVVCELLVDESTQNFGGEKPKVILVVGVNGVGKTTTIGKLAHRYKQEGQKVLLVAGDTFRAAAIEQLALWARRVDVGLVKHQHGADPSAVAFDGVGAAISRAVDVVIIDTAGRFHVKANLMEEVTKIARTVGRRLAGAPHEVLLVIDATTGQNALSQARAFHDALGVSGVVLTKLDGTAKGGIVLAIRAELGLPIRYVGLGEGPGDLTVFDPEAFASGLLPQPEMSNAA